MARPIFYHQTTKNVIVAFASIFDEVRYRNDGNEEIHVPIGYAPKSKFVEFYNSEPSFDTYDARFTLPRMAFELNGLNFAPERFYNPNGRMVNPAKDKYMYARIPYDFSFSLYLATKSFEDGLKIVEQIVPYFTPELTVTIKDKQDFDFKTDVPVVLNSCGYDIVYEGSFDDRRTIEWTLQFTVKAYLYGDVKIAEQIKETIVNLEQDEIDRKYTQLISSVDPLTAKANEPYTVIDTVNGNPSTWRQT
jgi:hypothetical protein